ncbi:MAG: Hsp20/alpha crystallin family protein [Betaproteobacteria bacterium]
MSAKWRPSNKNRKWQNINELIKSSDKKASRKIVSHPKTVSTNPNYRTAKSYGKRSQQEPKPLIDIFQDNSNITVVAEIAGFNKETVKIDVQDQKITLSAKSKDRRYYKSLNLPKVVIPDAMHTKYKNGVLEIKLKKAEAEPHAP